METNSKITVRVVALLLALAAVPAAPVMAQPMLDASTPMGTEYYIGFMLNDDEAASTKFMGLIITSQVSTTGSVEIPGFETKAFSAGPGQVSRIDIPRAFEHTVSEDTVSVGTTSITKAVRVTSRAPISVFVLNSRSQTSGGYAAIPIDQWGTRYLALALPNVLARRTSEIMIVAAHDETWVRFTPSATTYKQSRGVPTQIKLQRGRTYFVQALANSLGLDLSGSEILSTRPVGVICGHVRTTVTADGHIPSDPQAYAMHQAAMILPDSAWSREYVSAPMRASGDRFRLMPSAGATIVATQFGTGGTDRDTITLEAGEVRDLYQIDGKPINSPVHWVCSAPTLIMQMRTGTVYGDPANSPAAVVLNGTDAFSPRTAFVALDQVAGGAFPSHDLSLVVRVAPGGDAGALLGMVRMDGEKLASVDSYQRVGGTDFYTLRRTIASGGHVLVAPEGATLTGIVSGSNGTVLRDAYAWVLPPWGQPTDFDASAPFVASVQSVSRGLVTVVASDRTDGYFSGVVDISVAASASAGWHRVSINSPLPDEDAVATFQAIGDPSGPLELTLRDRDNNVKDTTAHASVCFKTASAETERIVLETDLDHPSDPVSIRLRTNSCGDDAHVTNVTLSGSDSGSFVYEFADLPLTIPAGTNAEIALVYGSPVALGKFLSTLIAQVDDSVVRIEVELNVGTASAVAALDPHELRLSIWPNPASDKMTIDFGAHLTGDAELVISDQLGRVVVRASGHELLSRHEYAWSGRSSDGSALPAGAYVVSLTERGRRSTTFATLLR